MAETEQIELNRKILPNGQVAVVYKSNGRIFRDLYASEADANTQDARKVLSRSYQKKEDQNKTTMVFIDPLNPSRILKTLKYSDQNVLLEETHFNIDNQKTLTRTYQKGILNQAWTFDTDGKIKSGVQYKVNAQGKYEIASISKPIFDSKGELSHTVQQETTPDGKPTGFISQRVFYLCNLPFVRANYTKDPENPNKVLLTISSLEEGVWKPVTDATLRNHLKSIFQDVITLEDGQLPQTTQEKVVEQEPTNQPQPSSSVLGQNANIEFNEMYYDEIDAFRDDHPSLKVIPISKVKSIPSQEERNQQIQSLTPEEQAFVQKANNAGLFVSFQPENKDATFLFAPTKAQYKNAQQARQNTIIPTDRLPYAALIEAKESFENVAVISDVESDSLPYLPTLRTECFDTLSNEEKCFVLRANLSGLNVTAMGDNYIPFLYMAPTSEAQQTYMRSQLERLEQTMSETLAYGGNIHHTSPEVDRPTPSRTHQQS